MSTLIQSELGPLARKLQLWKALEPPELEAVLRLPYTSAAIRPSQYIVREGDIAKHSCLLLSGFAFRQKLAGDGERSICAIHMKGDMVDLQNSLLGHADHSVQALTEARVAFIPREEIVGLALAWPQVGLAMWHDTLVDASIFREWVLNISRRDALTRIAHILCEFGMRLEAIGLGTRHSYVFPMTQEQLADATGLTSVHVNRMLMELARRGLIEREFRQVRVADWDALRRAADFDESYLHLDRAGVEQ